MNLQGISALKSTSVQPTSYSPKATQKEEVQAHMYLPYVLFSNIAKGYPTKFNELFICNALLNKLSADLYSFRLKAALNNHRCKKWNN